MYQWMEMVLEIDKTEILDREDAVEDRLQTDHIPFFVRDTGLKKLVVRTLLDVDQVRDLDDLLELPDFGYF